MIPDVSQALAWLENHPQALKGIQRGLERETLRVNADGSLATTGHPEDTATTEIYTLSLHDALPIY